MKIARVSLIEVLIGIWLLAVIVILTGVFWVSHPLSFVLGELVGSVTASALMLHLYRSIDIELDLPEEKAINHSRVMAMIRSAIELVVLFAGFYLAEWICPYTVLAGLLARKIAALMVPWMEKIRTRGNKAESQATGE